MAIHFYFPFGLCFILSLLWHFPYFITSLTIPFLIFPNFLSFCLDVHNTFSIGPYMDLLMTIIWLLNSSFIIHSSVAKQIHSSTSWEIHLFCRIWPKINKVFFFLGCNLTLFPRWNTYLLAQRNLDVHLDQKVQVVLRILFPQEVLEHHQDLGSLSYQQGLEDLHPRSILWLQEVLNQYKK